MIVTPPATTYATTNTIRNADTNTNTIAIANSNS